MPRPKNDDARPRLLSAGLSLFAKLGCERVNTNSIARRARVGIGTFYSHFDDKYALLQEIQVRTLEGLREARARELRRVPATPTAQARAAIAGAVEFARRHPEAYRVTMGRERTSTTRQRPVVTESTRPTADALVRLQSRGQLDQALDAELAARAYSAMEVGMLLWWIDDPKPSAPEGIVETLFRLHPVNVQPVRQTETVVAGSGAAPTSSSPPTGWRRVAPAPTASTGPKPGAPGTSPGEG